MVWNLQWKNKEPPWKVNYQPVLAFHSIEQTSRAHATILPEILEFRSKQLLQNTPLRVSAKLSSADDTPCQHGPNIHIYNIYTYIITYQHLQRGAKCFLKGINSPPLRVSLAPLWRSRYVISSFREKKPTASPSLGSLWTLDLPFSFDSSKLAQVLQDLRNWRLKLKLQVLHRQEHRFQSSEDRERSLVAQLSAQPLGARELDEGSVGLFTKTRHVLPW